MYNWAAYEYICAIKSTICHSLYPLKTFTHHTTAACELHRSLVVLFTTAALYLWPNDDNVLLSNNTHFLFVYYHHQVLQCAPDTLAISVCHRHPTKVQVRNVEHFRFFHWDASQSVCQSVSQSLASCCVGHDDPEESTRNFFSHSSLPFSSNSTHRYHTIIPAEYHCTLGIKLSSQSSSTTTGRNYNYSCN